MTNSKHSKEIGMFARREGFCKDISGIVGHRDVAEFDDAGIYLFACIVIVCVDVLRPCTVSVAFREGNERLIVSEEGDGCEVVPEILSEPDQPNSFC